MAVFIPTFLYIKQHTVTGLLYFGKTKQNPEKYLGSGTRWLNHIKKHGKEHVVNLWYCLFLDEETITNVALSFSRQHNIVESDDWANLMLENGATGGAVENNYLKILNKLPRSKSWNDAISKSLTGKAVKKYPVTIDGVKYDSITAAGRAFGLTDAAIHYWIKVGKASRYYTTG